MPRYAITQRAGPFVAAHHSTGIGTVPELTARQAEHELRLVTLVAPAPTPLASSPNRRPCKRPVDMHSPTRHGCDKPKHGTCIC